MASIGSLLGTAGGAGGTGFSSPTGTNSAQLGTAYNQTQQGIQQQQAFVNALMAQNGAQNQANVFGQLQNVASGQGPNPAQAQLAQATGQNIAAQQAAMAGQRGSSANAGLIARQAAQQGGALQQQSAGQAATTQANQSLNALGQLGGIAGQQVGQQQAGLNALNNTSLQQQGNLLGIQSNINSANAGLANTQLQGQQGLIGGLMGGASSALGAAAGAEGGKVSELPEFDVGGNVQAQSQGPTSSFGKYLQQNANQTNYGNAGANAMAQGMTKLGSSIGKMGNQSSPTQQDTPNPWANQTSISKLPQIGPGMAANNNAFAKGGKVPALVSPGEQYLPPKDVEKVKDGANPLSVGERIPGKPKHPGNDYRNDTVKKTLQSGGMVIPNKVMQAKNPHFEAMKFVHAHIAKNRHKK